MIHIKSRPKKFKAWDFRLDPADKRAAQYKREQVTMLGGIELGGTSIRCVVAASATEHVARHDLATTTPARDLAEVRDFFADADLTALGIASFGPLGTAVGRADYGQILDTPKRSWQGVNLIEHFSELCVPIAIHTDVNAAALAENALGASGAQPVCVYVTVGTGIGVGVVVDSLFLPGTRHAEMGHIRVRRDSYEDGFRGCCPFHGDCLEGLASGVALKQRWGQAVSTLPLDHLAWRLEAGYLGQLCVNLLTILCPQRIIMGGGVMQQEGLLERVVEASHTLMGGYHGYTLAELGSVIVAPQLADPGLTGSLLLATRCLD